MAFVPNIENEKSPLIWYTNRGDEGHFSRYVKEIDYFLQGKRKTFCYYDGKLYSTYFKKSNCSTILLNAVHEAMQNKIVNFFLGTIWILF